MNFFQRVLDACSSKTEELTYVRNVEKQKISLVIKIFVLNACSSKTEELTYVRNVLNSYDEN